MVTKGGWKSRRGGGWGNWGEGAEDGGSFWNNHIQYAGRGNGEGEPRGDGNDALITTHA